MRTRLLLLPIITASTLLLAGCSSVGGAAASAPAASSAPAADLRPWASAMAKQSTALDELRGDLNNDGCDAATSNDILCGAKLTAASFQAQTISIMVDAATTTGAQDYIGDPPAEIAGLYADTKSAAAAASDAGSVWSDDCIGEDSMACLHKAGEFTDALDDLAGQFAAWSPYS